MESETLNKEDGKTESNSGYPDIASGKNERNKNKKALIIVLFIVVAIIAIVLYIFFIKGQETPSVANEGDGKAASSNSKDIKKTEVDRTTDTDQDGLCDYLEGIIGTDSNKSDTDGDGYSDLAEIKNGYDPLATEKYSVEEWDSVKMKIKTADEEFYGKNFGNVSQGPLPNSNTSPASTKKCEFPANIGEYTGPTITEIPVTTGASDAPKALTMVSYTGWNINYFFVHNNVDNANSQLAKAKKDGAIDCEIAGIKGVCKYNQSAGAGERINVEGDFLWRENNTVKVLMNTNADVLSESVEAGEKRAKEKLTLFASQFKDCEIDLIKK